MISAERIAHVRRLLETEPELSQRDIALRTGVSRATVGLVASGRRRDHVPRPIEEERPKGPPARCPGCGGMVYHPCRLCRVRSLQTGQREQNERRRNNPFVDASAAPRDRAGERMDQDPRAGVDRSPWPGAVPFSA